MSPQTRRCAVIAARCLSGVTLPAFSHQRLASAARVARTPAGAGAILLAAITRRYSASTSLTATTVPSLHELDTSTTCTSTSITTVSCSGASLPRSYLYHHHHHQHSLTAAHIPVHLRPHRLKPILTQYRAQQRRVLQTSSNPNSSSLSPTRHCSAAEQYITPAASTGNRSFPYLSSYRARSRARIPFLMGQAREESGDSHSHAHHDHHHHHGFGHHHHHDNTYLMSSNKSDPGVRITRIGLLSNLAMAIAKFVGGWAFNSKSMIADAWHSIADLASDVLTLATVSWSLKPPTDNFPMGFGKVESLGSLGVSGMLLVGGFYMGWESAISLYGHFINAETAEHLLEHIGHGHSHSHSHSHGALGVPSLHAAWLAMGTILVKEWLYHATMKVAKERKSSVLASNAVHHRVDSLTGIVTLFAILGANMVENAAWLDPVGGLLISIMVVHAGYSNSLEAFQELIDHSMESEVKNSVRKQALKSLATVSEGHLVEVRDVGGIKSGQNYLVDVEMVVPGTWTVDDVKEVEDAVRTQVGAKVRGVRRIRVRFISQSAADDAKFDEYIPGEMVHDKPEQDSHDEEEEGSGHLHKHDHEHKH